MSGIDLRKAPIRRVEIRLARLQKEIEEASAPRPLPDDGRPVDFGRVSDLSLAMTVPDDVKSEWLALAYEAVTAMRDRSAGDSANDNVALANKTIADLERRFPGRP